MIQPIDIKAQSFKKGLFGYNKIDVDSFKDTVCKAYEDAIAENNRLSEENEKLKKVVEESRVKIFELEKKAGKSGGGASAEDSEKAKKIIEEAQKSAAEIIARAKAEGDKIVNGAASGTAAKAEPKDDKKSATSKFFENAEEKASDVFGGDDDEVFVGEIEDNRKPSKVMIGDGEEEEDADFEFL
ncbi:MAG: DivIVA domain-containing protein [Eubacterium sp.]|nr:DivIVA domain-containing protein [Eubacterium sp.]